MIDLKLAAPAFIGYTEHAGNEKNGETPGPVPVELASLAEYERRFGGRPFSRVAEVSLDSTGSIAEIDRPSRYFLHEAVRLFFANGGERCWVVSAGRYRSRSTVSRDALLTALRVLREFEGPSLLVAPDTVSLKPDLSAEVQRRMLRQAAHRGDQFALLDVPQHLPLPAAVDNFRRHLGEDLPFDHGIACVPFLRSSLSQTVRFSEIKHLPLARRFAQSSDAELAAQFAAAGDPASDPANENELRRLAPTYGAFMVRFDREPIVLPPSAALAGLLSGALAGESGLKSAFRTCIRGVAGLADELSDELVVSFRADRKSGISVNAFQDVEGCGCLLASLHSLSGRDLASSCRAGDG